MHATMSVPYHSGASTRDADYTHCKLLVTNRCSTTYAMTILGAYCTCIDDDVSCWNSHPCCWCSPIRARVITVVEHKKADATWPPRQRESYNNKKSHIVVQALAATITYYQWRSRASATTLALALMLFLQKQVGVIEVLRICLTIAGFNQERY